MKPILPFAGILAVSLAAAPAASISVNTVGTVNGNGKTILEATGNSLNVTTFASNIATAYANNTGGVWDFDGAAFAVNVGETITLNYGNSQANSLVMTMSSGNTINQAVINTTEQTSASNGLGLANATTDRVFTLSTPLQSIGIFVGNRGDASRTSVLSVTFLDNTTASTSGANMGPAPGSNYFEGLSATGTNYIKSFSLSQNNYVRYDDLGFIAVPESSSAALLGLVGFGALIRRRR